LHHQKTVILSDRSAAKRVEGPAVAFCSSVKKLNKESLLQNYLRNINERQGTTLVVPQTTQNKLGFSPCGRSFLDFHPICEHQTLFTADTMSEHLIKSMF
jgi:hypothetical protein